MKANSVSCLVGLGFRFQVCGGLPQPCVSVSCVMDECAQSNDAKGLGTGIGRFSLFFLCYFF